jgi:hypothetical protein
MAVKRQSPVMTYILAKCIFDSGLMYKNGGSGKISKSAISNTHVYIIWKYTS